MATIHRFTVGDITCIALEEGTSTFAPDSLRQRYPNATEDQIQDALDKIGFDEGELRHAMNTLYIEADGKKILIDAGMGTIPERPNVGQTVPSLALAGITPEEIDIVFITHFHSDHYLGLLTDGEPTYPNAQYMTLDTEWTYWLENEDEAMAQRIEGIKKVVEPLKDQFSTLSAGDEIATGVSVMAIAGHTMGQSAIKIESGDEMVIHLVDLLHNETQFAYSDWHFVWDTDADLAVQSRKAQLGNAVNRHLLVMFYHLPFPGLGYVERTDKAFKWLPIAD
ncbi:MAG: MBL fold metallo-hydrolase [Chloroflexota bacterium]